jgi:hypothetical protein
MGANRAEPLTVCTCVRVQPALPQAATARAPRVLPVKALFGTYTFDAVFTEAASQRDVFDSGLATEVEALLEGQHALVIAYGAARTGKTYTLQVHGTAVTPTAGVLHCWN